MKFLIVSIALGFIVFSNGLNSSAGVWIANGGDYLDQNAKDGWFWGPQNQIHYCTVVSDDFGIPAPVASRMVFDSFTKWTQYITDKKVEVSPQRTLRLQELPACDGTEDIKFYFGVEDATVLSARSQFNEPFGFAVRQSYDTEKKWGKGFVWIASPNKYGEALPNWKNPVDLFDLLLHEWGHVFGCEHVDGTIMEADFASTMIAGANQTKLVAPGEIDQGNELLLCIDCQTTYSGTVSGGAFPILFSTSPMDADIQGQITLQLNPQIGPWATFTCGLSISPYQAANSMEFGTNASNYEDRPGEATVFSSLHPLERTYYGVLDGKSITIDRNGSRRLEILAFDPNSVGGPIPIFKSNE